MTGADALMDEFSQGRSLDDHTESCSMTLSEKYKIFVELSFGLSALTSNKFRYVNGA